MRLLTARSIGARRPGRSSLLGGAAVIAAAGSDLAAAAAARPTGPLRVPTSAVRAAGLVTAAGTDGCCTLGVLLSLSPVALSNTVVDDDAGDGAAGSRTRSSARCSCAAVSGFGTSPSMPHSCHGVAPANHAMLCAGRYVYTHCTCFMLTSAEPTERAACDPRKVRHSLPRACFARLSHMSQQLQHVCICCYNHAGCTQKEARQPSQAGVPSRLAGDAQRPCSTGRCHSSSSVLQVTAMMGTRGVLVAPPALGAPAVPSFAAFAGELGAPRDASVGCPAGEHDTTSRSGGHCTVELCLQSKLQRGTSGNRICT